MRPYRVFTTFTLVRVRARAADPGAAGARAAGAREAVVPEAGVERAGPVLALFDPWPPPPHPARHPAHTRRAIAAPRIGFIRRVSEIIVSPVDGSPRGSPRQGPATRP